MKNYVHTGALPACGTKMVQKLLYWVPTLFFSVILGQSTLYANDNWPLANTENAAEIYNRSTISFSLGQAQTEIGNAIAMAKAMAIGSEPLAKALAGAETIIGNAISLADATALSPSGAAAIAEALSFAHSVLGNAYAQANSMAINTGGPAVAISIAVAISFIGDAVAVANSIAVGG